MQTVVNVKVPIIDSIAYDQTLNRLWFLANNSLAYYNLITKNPVYTIEKNFTSNSDPRYMTIDHTDHLWVTLSAADQIAMYDPAAKTTTLYGLPSKGSTAWGLTVAPDNTIWFAEAFGRKIGHLTPCSQLSSCITEYTPPQGINLAAPVQVAIATNGLIWFTDHGSNQFGSLNPSANEWKVFPIANCPSDCGNGLPNAISIDSSGRIWLSEHFAGRIAEYDPNSGTLIEYIVPVTRSPSGPASGAFTWWAWPGQGNLVWFSSLGLGQIGYVNATLPINLNVTAPASIILPRGSSNNLAARVAYQGPEALSIAVSPTTPDAPTSFPAQIYGSSNPNQLSPSPNPQTSTVTISSAWNSTLGPRNVGLTVSNGHVNVNKFVQVNIVDPPLPYLTLGVAFFIIIGIATLWLRRPKITRILKSSGKKTVRGG